MNDELAARFPDMAPITSAPTLNGINGFGMGLHGRRDDDPETGTYVSTQTLTLLFIPVLSLRAFRIADHPQGGWYFLGRVPLSKFARRCNLLTLLLVLLGGVGIWYSVHTGSPEYKAGQQLAKADAAAAEGQAKAAAEQYRDLLAGPKAAEGNQKLAELLRNLPGDGTQAAGALAVGVDLNRTNRSPVPDLLKIGTDYAAAKATSDPKGALAVLEIVAPLAEDATLDDQREKILDALVKAEPQNILYVTKLAALCENGGRLDKCKVLLEPFEDKLGESEGAAILGRVRFAEGDFDKAYRLLMPYVSGHIGPLQSAEAQYVAAVKAANASLMAELNSEKAAGFNYSQYRTSTTALQEQMVDDWVTERLRNDPNVRAARDAVAAQKAVVPAALDLGLVQLQRGRAAADPAERKRELEAAERTFMAVRGLAGQSDQFKLTLGQVYYWLGKAAEGRKLIDAALEGTPQAQVVMTAANVLREVGLHDEARKVVETAYERETLPETRQALAAMRSAMQTDLDDQIRWLSRSNPKMPDVKAGLATAQGDKARRDGQIDTAKAHYEASIAIYDAMPESVSMLNNSALVIADLYSLTGDAATFARATERIDRAIALKPSDSIVLGNSSSMLMRAVARDAVGHGIDLAALGRSADWDMVPYLYRTSAEADALYAKVTKHPGMVKSKAYAEKMILLAPKSTSGYAMLQSALYMAKDVPGMQKLADQTLAADFSDSGQKQRILDLLSGKDDARDKANHKSGLDIARKTWEAVKDRKNATAAFAAGQYIQSALGDDFWGNKVDHDALVKLAETMQAAAPSTGIRNVYENALLHRAHARLIAMNPAYAAQAKATHRLFGVNLAKMYMAANGPIGDAVRADPDVKKWIANLAFDVREMTDHVGPLTAYLLRATEPALAKQAEATYQANKVRVLSDEVTTKLNPYSVDECIRRYYALLLAGQPAEAKKAFAKLAADGLPVPKLD